MTPGTMTTLHLTTGQVEAILKLVGVAPDLWKQPGTIEARGCACCYNVSLVLEHNNTAHTSEPVKEPVKVTQVPTEVVPQLERLLGLTPKQVDTVLQLISLPENGNPRWWEHYAYIEDLNDGRGFTCTLFGACSGTGDMLMIFEEVMKIDAKHPLVKFIPSLRKCKAGHIDAGCKGLPSVFKGLSDDAVWRQAVWIVYIKLYWTFAAEFCAKKGSCAKRPGPVLTTPASKGFLVDTSLNHGSNMQSVMYIVNKMQNKDATDEAAWMTDFAKTRKAILKSGHESLDTSLSGHRSDLWMPLFKSNVELEVPIKSTGKYWGTYTVQ